MATSQRNTTRLGTTLLDLDRLAVAGALAARPLTTDGLVDATGRDRQTVLSALGDLRAAGVIVAADDGSYALDEAAFRAAAQDEAEVDVPMDPVIGFGMSDDERVLLERFFSGRVLNEIPAQRAKRVVVLQRLALEFDIGRRYTEPEVNEILGAFNTDWSTLRRGLVDEHLLDRESSGGGNLYWRSGGRITDLPPA
ncbi:MAG: DUF2087 domain-containing protein [Ilumatobacteraceae bacterium]